jgi:hypothetical protein
VVAVVGVAAEEDGLVEVAEDLVDLEAEEEVAEARAGVGDLRTLQKNIFTCQLHKKIVETRCIAFLRFFCQN